MSSNTHPSFIAYSENTKSVCTLIVIASLLILILIVSPLNFLGWRLTMGKFIILLLLGIAIYKNFTSTHQLSTNIKGLFSSPDLSSLRNNVLLSHVYSLLIIILFIYIFISLFD